MSDVVALVAAMATDKLDSPGEEADCGRMSRHTLSCWGRLLVLSSLTLGITGTIPLAAQPPIPPAFGPHVGLKESDFSGCESYTMQDRIVGTYYFYWYCAETKDHLVDEDGSDALTDHPATLDGFSYRSTAWHKKELRDMMAAGIDVVLPVFWGAPSEQDARAGLHWSYTGLARLVEAREELLREGKRPPRVGMFYDTSTLQHNRWGQHIDLTTDYGRRWFYATVRDFFSLVPPKHWAMLEGRPIVLLYAAGFARAHDQSFLDYTLREFARDFGGRKPWVASEISWRVRADSRVAWGGALGLRNPGVAALGPGYDHSAVPGRTPLVVPRENGAFYERNWLRFLRRPSHFVVVETWNEYHEGTDIAESREYGRRYIELTRRYTDLYRQGWKPPWPNGGYQGSNSVSATYRGSREERGLTLLDQEDGRTAMRTLGGQSCLAIRPTVHPGRYIYFAVDDSFKQSEPAAFVVDLEYYDASSGRLALEFDGSDVNAPFNGAYSSAEPSVNLQGSRSWRAARFVLKGARFMNSQNGGADLRFAVDASDFAIRKITLTRAEP